MAVKGYRDLEVWQRAMILAEGVYALVVKLPDAERFALSSQIRRAAVSVPSNIAEGCGRNTTKDFVQFLTIARGSLMELETQLTLAVRLKLLDRADVIDVWKIAEQVSQMLNKLISVLRKRAKSRTLRTTNHEPRTTTKRQPEPQ